MMLRSRQHGEQGFTLVEMLVALLLMSLVGLTLAQFQTFQLGSTRQLAGTTAARLEADNRAIDLLVAPGAPVGVLTGVSQNVGSTWYWSATPMGSPDPVALPQLVRIDIIVSATPGGPAMASRQIVRPQ